MLTYTPPDKQLTTKTNEKPIFLILLVFVWLWPGIIGHDLWNANENFIYSLIKNINSSKSHITPEIYNYFYIQNSPIYIYLGYFFKKIFTFFGISSYTSVRLVTTFFMSVSLLCAGMAGKYLIGNKHGRSTVLILIGCPGIIIFGHSMNQLSILFFAFSVYALAIAIGRIRTSLSSFCMGLSFILTFYIYNITICLFLIILSFLLFIHPFWRTKKYIINLITSLTFALPLIFIWPLLLFLNNQDNFYFWLKYYAFYPFDISNPKLMINFHLKEGILTTLWYLLPAWILTIWTIYKEKKQIFIKYNYFFCITWIIFGSIIFLIQSDFEHENLILIVIPMAILATAKLDDLKGGHASFLNWLGISIFGIAAIIIFLSYLTINFNLIPILNYKLYSINHFYKHKILYFPLFIAIFFIPFWIFAITRKNIRGRQAITNWAAGITFVWTITLTLFLPWLNSMKTYKLIVENMNNNIPYELMLDINNGAECINTKDQTILIVWNEYGQIPIYKNQECNYTLININKKNILNINKDVIWINSRNQITYESFLLIKNK